MYRSNFIKQHCETVMFWNYQGPGCNLTKKNDCVIYCNFRHTSVPYCLRVVCICHGTDLGHHGNVNELMGIGGNVASHSHTSLAQTAARRCTTSVHCACDCVLKSPQNALTVTLLTLWPCVKTNLARDNCRMCSLWDMQSRSLSGRISVVTCFLFYFIFIQ